MDNYSGIGIYVDTARFVPANMFFKDSNVTKERTVRCYEIVFFLKDGGYAVINDKKYPITAGSVRFHRPGDRVYSYRFNEIYVIHFNVDNEEKGKEIFSRIPSFVRFPDIENEIIILKKLIAALLEQDDFECILCIWDLLGRIKYQSQIQQKNNKKRTVFQMKNYIDKNFSHQLTLAELAQNFHMHPVYMQRKFKKEAGITPAEYLKKVRLSNAKAYLLTTDFTIDEISEMCGFCNTSYFIKVFKNKEALTPSQFRQRALLPDIFL